MSYLFKSVLLQAATEKALEREKVEARVSALQELRWEFCGMIDDLIAREEGTLAQELDEMGDL